mgnify:CR=1 FL=1
MAPNYSAARAIYYGNLAACRMHLLEYEAAVAMSTKALEIDPKYVKVLMRRSVAYEKLGDDERAVEDAKQARW